MRLVSPAGRMQMHMVWAGDRKRGPACLRKAGISKREIVKTERGCIADPRMCSEGQSIMLRQVRHESEHAWREKTMTLRDTLRMGRGLGSAELEIPVAKLVLRVPRSYTSQSQNGPYFKITSAPSSSL